MDIYKTFEQSKKPTVVALGYFDGVHMAHQRILNEAAAYAKSHCLTLCVVTFTMDIELPNKPGIKNIMTDEIRIEVFARHSVQRVYIPPFSEISELSYQEFFEVLNSKLLAQAVFCGYNYTFGKNAKGNVERLVELCDENGMDLYISNPEKRDNELLSSERIRGYIENGDMVSVNHMLGAYFFIRGKVVHGNHLGRTLGFPTANIIPEPNQILPKHGVYRSFAFIGDLSYRGVTNVGVKPTVSDGLSPVVETHILDYDGDLYGEIVLIAFIEMIREEKKFASTDELKQAMQADVDSITKRTHY